MEFGKIATQFRAPTFTLPQNVPKIDLKNETKDVPKSENVNFNNFFGGKKNYFNAQNVPNVPQNVPNGPSIPFNFTPFATKNVPKPTFGTFGVGGVSGLFEPKAPPPLFGGVDLPKLCSNTPFSSTLPTPFNCPKPSQNVPNVPNRAFGGYPMGPVTHTANLPNSFIPFSFTPLPPFKPTFTPLEPPTDLKREPCLEALLHVLKDGKEETVTSEPEVPGSGKPAVEEVPVTGKPAVEEGPGTGKSAVEVEVIRVTGSQSEALSDTLTKLGNQLVIQAHSISSDQILTLRSAEQISSLLKLLAQVLDQRIVASVTNKTEDISSDIASDVAVSPGSPVSPMEHFEALIANIAKEVTTTHARPHPPTRPNTKPTTTARQLPPTVYDARNRLPMPTTTSDLGPNLCPKIDMIDMANGGGGDSKVAPKPKPPIIKRDHSSPPDRGQNVARGGKTEAQRLAATYLMDPDAGLPVVTDANAVTVRADRLNIPPPLRILKWSGQPSEDQMNFIQSRESLWSDLVVLFKQKNLSLLDICRLIQTPGVDRHSAAFDQAIKNLSAVDPIKRAFLMMHYGELQDFYNRTKDDRIPDDILHQRRIENERKQRQRAQSQARKAAGIPAAKAKGRTRNRAR